MENNQPDSLYVVMPAYNEEANIQNVIEEWMGVLSNLQAEVKLVIVNDGSKDHTYEQAKTLVSRFPELQVIDKENSGHGSTVLYAYKHAVSEGADYVFQTDSDGQTKPEELVSLWEERRNYDFQIGERTGREDGLGRVFVSKTLKIVVRRVFGVSIPDPNTPFRLIRREALESALARIPKDFFLSNVLVSLFLVKLRWRGRWVPISFRPRQGGVNSINMRRIARIGTQAIGEFKRVREENQDVFAD